MTLIQTGGGNGPTKPGQPTDRCGAKSDGVSREMREVLALFRLGKGGFSMEDAVYITARYRVPWQQDVTKRAEQIAVGMTVGSWTDLPDVRKPHLRRYLGRVKDVWRDGSDALMDIQYPLDNVRPHIASLLTVVFGKVSLDGQIRLEALELPPAYIDQFPGPRWGIPGIRKLLQVPDRPLVMSIFKSENGRYLDEFAEAFEAQINGGVDLVKDDEIFLADQFAPLTERIQVARERLEKRAQRTGQKGLYIVNVSGSPATILKTCEKAAEAGADGFLISGYTVGLDILTDIRRENIPGVLVLHPAFVGGQIADSRLGVHPAVLLGTLPRLAGADIVLYPSPYGSVSLPAADSLAVAEKLRTLDDRHPPVWPGPSAGIHAGMLPTLFRDFGPDVIINAGGAVHGHPEGTEAGARVLADAAQRFLEVKAR